MGIIYLTEEQAMAHLCIGKERFDDAIKRKPIKAYRRGETKVYKQSDLDTLTWDDLMEPIDPDGDEGTLFESEVSRW